LPLARALALALALARFALRGTSVETVVEWHAYPSACRGIVARIGGQGQGDPGIVNEWVEMLSVFVGTLCAIESAGRVRAQRL
jgi:hypothetical protein